MLQTSNITTRQYCYLSIAAAFHKQTELLKRRNRQLFQEKSALFCQTEIIKLVALCCNVNIQHASNIFHFSQNVQKWSIYPVTNFQCLTDVIGYWKTVFLFQGVFKVYNETKKADVLDIKTTTHCVFVHIYTFLNAFSSQSCNQVVWNRLIIINAQ